MRAVPSATLQKPVWCLHSRLSNRAADRSARRLAVTHAYLTDFEAMNEASRRPTVARTIRYGSAPPAPTSPKQPRFGCRHETESHWVQESPTRPLATISPRQGPPPEIPASLREPTKYIESNGIAPRTTRERRNAMQEHRLMVAEVLGVSKPYAYKLIRKLNEELERTGCS